MKKLENGFYTALGTPLDKDGKLISHSLKKHINQQIDAGAAGLLLMGSMGIEAYLTGGAYKDAVVTGVEATAGRVPLFVGAMDTSIAKVMEKIDMIGNADIDGVVITAPFYSGINDAQAIKWFTTIADKSPHPIYIYDLAVTVRYKVTMSVMDKLIKHPNIKGIKTADWEMIHAIERKYSDENFQCLYSGLDSFDYANMMGICKNLDGMFACTPKNGKKMADALKASNFEEGRKYLDNILYLRDTMIKFGLMKCFTHCMNLLGCEGNFHQDYCVEITDEARATMEKIMKEIGEL